MTKQVERNGLSVSQELSLFIEHDVCAGLQFDTNKLWAGLAQLVEEFGPRNRQLLEKRERLQLEVDQYHRAHKNKLEFDDYKSFLQKIGYLVDPPKDITIKTTNVDSELATQAGPQLVVPIMNARYALNAANARWGSLYDALYGTDVISEAEGAEKGGVYNPVRGQRVISYAREFLDDHFGLVSGSHRDAKSYAIKDGLLQVTLLNGTATTLVDPSKLLGFQGKAEQPDHLLLSNHHIHIDIVFDAHHPIGQTDPTNMADIIVESALSTIMDCEDSVAAVDAEDKTIAYRNWYGLMSGKLEERFQKGGKEVIRKLNTDRVYQSVSGGEITLPGRSLLFVRNVGHLMMTDAVKDKQGDEIPEGILDGLMTSLISLYDIRKQGVYQNSREGSIYIVKPKMHGPEEVAFTNDLFGAIEDILELPRYTIKMGIMDEERRTTVNLGACIAAAEHRVAFINTGFLDRTGDEIHTSMLAGPVLPKAEMKMAKWIQAYENANVDIGLAMGLSGRAQIGKGMWAVPDNMSDMMAQKIAHPKAGANTAWVPSPTAATLHAIHYHMVDVAEVQNTLSERVAASVDDILQIPLLPQGEVLDPVLVQRELDNNIQGILGYVVRWVDLGIGCSKVPDINNVGLMEDRATLRISAQHICNWLEHGIVSSAQVDETLKRMALVVDGQNKAEPEYKPMAEAPELSFAFAAARDLIFKGKSQPSGYTEPLLHLYRRKVKARYLI